MNSCVAELKKWKTYTAVLLLDEAWEHVKQQLHIVRFHHPNKYSQICASAVRIASLCNFKLIHFY